MELIALSDLSGSVTIPTSQFLQLVESHNIRLDEKKGKEKEIFHLEKSVELILKVVLDNITDKSLLGGITNPLLLLINENLIKLNCQVSYTITGTTQNLLLGSTEEEATKIDLNQYLS